MNSCSKMYTNALSWESIIPLNLLPKSVTQCGLKALTRSTVYSVGVMPFLNAVTPWLFTGNKETLDLRIAAEFDPPRNELEMFAKLLSRMPDEAISRIRRCIIYHAKEEALPKLCTIFLKCPQLTVVNNVHYHSALMLRLSASSLPNLREFECNSFFATNLGDLDNNVSVQRLRSFSTENHGKKSWKQFLTALQCLTSIDVLDGNPSLFFENFKNFTNLRYLGLGIFEKTVRPQCISLRTAMASLTSLHLRSVEFLWDRLVTACPRLQKAKFLFCIVKNNSGYSYYPSSLRVLVLHSLIWKPSTAFHHLCFLRKMTVCALASLEIDCASEDFREEMEKMVAFPELLVNCKVALSFVRFQTSRLGRIRMGLSKGCMNMENDWLTHYLHLQMQHNNPV